MELYALHSTTQEELHILDHYKSLIWNERYRDPGEFVLTTTKMIQDTMTKLPLNSLVGLDDSDEVMIVENHDLDMDENGDETLTVSGRSYEVAYEGRTTLELGGEKMNDDGDPTAQIWTGPITSAAVAAALADNAMPIPTKFPSDENLGSYGTFTTPTAIPSLIWRIVNRAQTYDEMLRWMDEDNLGVRNFRPGNVNIYNGRDRTATVILDWKAGHFERFKYLASVKGMKTEVHCATKTNYRYVVNAGMGGYTGVAKRVGLLELSDVTQTGATGDAILDSRGKSYLAQHKKTVIVDAKVAEDIPYTYKIDYFLGDTVKVIGKYGINLNMMVTEYLRTKDENGEVVSYPALSIPNT